MQDGVVASCTGGRRQGNSVDTTSICIKWPRRDWVKERIVKCPGQRKIVSNARQTHDADTCSLDQSVEVQESQGLLAFVGIWLCSLGYSKC